MNKFISQIHTIGNYNIRFSRIDVTKNKEIMINKIEFLDKITNRNLVDFKMDFSTTKLLNIYLHALKNRYTNYFILDIPSYNTIEICKIDCRIVSPNKIVLKLNFNNNIIESGFSIVFTAEEFDMFVDQYFFYLLIDVVQDQLEE